MRRTEKHKRRIAERMATRFGVLSMRALDYRYWQCRRCGFDADRADVWAWWSSMHWMDRDIIVRLSPYWMVREEQRDSSFLQVHRIEHEIKALRGKISGTVSVPLTFDRLLYGGVPHPVP